jgi:hypothetical protein
METKPWEHSSGSKTWIGKRISSQNSLQHGLRCRNGAIYAVGRFLLIEEEYRKALEDLRKWLPEAVKLRQRLERENPELIARLMAEIDQQTTSEESPESSCS